MAERKDNQTKTAFFLNLTFTVLELIGGIISGSIAILADSLHDFADSLSLGAGWYFEEKSKKGKTDTYTFGYARFSLLGAVINAITLLLGSIFIVYKSIDRILNPQMPDVYWMLGISIAGIALNGFAVWKLKSGKSMNKQVMTIHLLEDALGWVAVLIASIVLLFVEVPILDPILAIVINLTVLFFVMKKLVKSFKIMMQRVPDNVNLPELRQKILCIDTVKNIKNLNIWSLTEEKLIVDLQVVPNDSLTIDKHEDIRRKVKDILKDLNAEQVTIEIST